MTKVWIREPSVLLENPLDFFPKAGQTPAEKANSLSRLCIYVSIVVGAYRNRLIPFAIGGLVAAVAVAYSVSGTPSDEYGELSVPSDVDNSGVARGPGEGSCTRPTANNPFANALAVDFGDPSFAPACKVTSPGVANEQKKFFEKGLVRSIYDPYGRQNNQRTFYTMPSPTGVADTTAVRNFLYGTSLNCKSNMRDCTSRPMCKESEEGGGAACNGFFKSEWDAPTGAHFSRVENPM